MEGEKWERKQPIRESPSKMIYKKSNKSDAFNKRINKTGIEIKSIPVRDPLAKETVNVTSSY